MKRAIILLAVFSLIISSATKASIAKEPPINVFVSILPQSYFVERIGGERISVKVLVDPGEDPHTFDPTPKQMMALSDAQLYFGIGFPFEHRILRKMQSSNLKLKLVHTDRGINRRPLDDAHNHKTELDRNYNKVGVDNHEEGGLDPHIWLSVPEIKIQVKNIHDALLDIDPSHRAVYQNNLDQFLKELEKVDAALHELFKPYRGRTFFVFHPSFGYFADTYGLKQIPIEIEGKSPTPRQIEALIKEAKRQNARIIFVSPQFSQKSAEIISRAIGGAVVPINPMEKNVLKNLEDIALKIHKSLE
ncbi:MAG: zinc ABC transporter substrate-binding protein [Spirochaetota bacterium]|nr:MAG: zinc ABC transporter substrate-binding protein [Spirochaetota bacterium]